jgi:cyclopropane-fatty-acyl-phospholipid synthase
MRATDLAHPLGYSAGDDPRPGGRAAGVPTPSDLASLIRPLPRLLGPTGPLVRRLALAAMRATWTGAPIDLDLPDHQRVRLGSASAGPAAARARIRDDRLFLRVLLRGEMGAGEAFVAGEWDAPDGGGPAGSALVAVIRAFLRTTAARGLESPLTRIARLPDLLRHRRAANSRAGSERNIHSHYDLGNSFYRLFLDEESLSYSCAVWPRPDLTLAEAQTAKHERMCALLELGPRDRVLEIGCGWGGMAIHAARTRGCRVTAITVSREQHDLARARIAHAGVADRVEIQYRDYRELDGTFDKIVSIEMLEAVGYEYLPRYFATCGRVLRPGGLLAVQSITMPDDRFAAYRTSVDWMQTYIFPGALIPSLGAIRGALPGSGLALIHADDIGLDYVPTLRAWHDRFAARRADALALGFDEPFLRTWTLYLAFSEAAFAERTLGDHHLVFRRC